MRKSISDLYIKYRQELRPLITEFEAQNEMFVTAWLVSLSSMFDRIALFETENNEDERNRHLNEAEKHLQNAIKVSRRGLIASYMQQVELFRRRYSQAAINRIGDGKFVGPFTALENEVRAIKDADEEKVFNKLSEMMSMIRKNHESALANSMDDEPTQTTVIKWTLTVLISLIVSFFISILW